MWHVGQLAVGVATAATTDDSVVGVGVTVGNEARSRGVVQATTWSANDSDAPNCSRHTGQVAVVMESMVFYRLREGTQLLSTFA